MFGKTQFNNFLTQIALSLKHRNQPTGDKKTLKMRFLVLCQHKVLLRFKKNENYGGGIYVRNPDHEFSYAITEIPENIEAVYFHYDEGSFAYIMNNAKYLKDLHVFPFFITDDKLTIGLSVLFDRGMELLNSGDLNLASTLLLRSTALAELSREPEVLKLTQNAYYEELPNKFNFLGKELLAQQLFNQAAYYFRQALLISPNNSESAKLLKEANAFLIKTPISNPASKRQGFHDGDPVALSDLRNINLNDYEASISICEKCRAMVESRESYVNGKKLDKKIAMPSNYWSGKITGFLLSPAYDVINHLRLHSYVFTGMKLRDIMDPINSSVPKKLTSRFSELTKGLPKELIANPPRILGEIGWQWKGGTLNADVVAYQERLSLIYKAGLYKRIKNKERPVILEIGSGYGALACFLKQAIPQAQIIVCDLPESLALAAVYLRIAFPDHTHFIYEGGETDEANSNADFIYIPNFIFNQWPMKSIDLAINTLSFAEMTMEQVRDYVSSIKAGIGAEGYLFEQNQDKRVNVAEIISGCGLKRISTERGQQGVANVWKNP